MLISGKKWLKNIFKIHKIKRSNTKKHMLIPVDDKKHTFIWNDHYKIGKDGNVLNTGNIYALLKKKAAEYFKYHWAHSH